MQARQGDHDQDETIKRDVIEQLESLDTRGKREVLDFTRALAMKRRSQEKGGALLAVAGAIPPDVLAEMSRIIEEECERIDHEVW